MSHFNDYALAVIATKVPDRTMTFETAHRRFILMQTGALALIESRLLIP